MTSVTLRRIVLSIILTHRPDLEVRINELAKQLGYIRRGLKNRTIEHMLEALEKLDAERSSRERILKSL